MRVRQTTCHYCRLDIENFAPYRKGEWRDRGNNTHCPDESKRAHAPYIETREDRDFRKAFSPNKYGEYGMTRELRQTKYACLPRSSWVLVLAAIHATAALAQDLKLEEIGFDLAVQLDLEDAWKRAEIGR